MAIERDSERAKMIIIIIIIVARPSVGRSVAISAAAAAELCNRKEFPVSQSPQSHSL